ARRLRARRGRHQGGAPLREGAGRMSNLDGGPPNERHRVERSPVGHPYRVAVVGATGAVGTVMLAKLKERGFPASEIVPFASERSAGKELDGAIIQPLTDETIQGFDLALFSAGGSTSGEWAPRFVEAGAVVVDNSSKWRRDPEVPLVVSEVNPQALDGHKGLIANPNCSTMQLMVALKPIHERAGIERLIVSTYQSVSGTGVKAVAEL